MHELIYLPTYLPTYIDLPHVPQSGAILSYSILCRVMIIVQRTMILTVITGSSANEYE